MPGTRGYGVALVFESSARWTSPSVAPRTRTTALFFLGQFGRETDPCNFFLKLPRHSANWPRHSAMACQGPSSRPTAAGATYTNNRAFFNSASIRQRNASHPPLQKLFSRHSANWPRHSAMAGQGPCPTARCSLFQCFENQRAIGFLLAVASRTPKKLHSSVLCFWSNSAEKRTLQNL